MLRHSAQIDLGLLTTPRSWSILCSPCSRRERVKTESL